jgi:thioredoxin reductase/NAD-dependent dihydropyrimidine dehydrogenase PreA subunit
MNASDLLLTLVYLVPVLLTVLVYLGIRRREEARHLATLADTQASGLTEAASLHPSVDPNRCIGSGGCARACPEQAIGIVGGKAVLISPAACIGHGACAAACPVEAITLVFGSERRGVEIPAVTPEFETNVPGLFIAGELGGMALIRKAAEQGRQAMAFIARRRDPHFDFDVVIVGAGPAGISAGLGAVQARLRYALIEQESSLGGSVLHYPRHKVAMTAPVDLPIIGKMSFVEVSKEKLLEFWLAIVARTKLQIRTGVRMDRVEPKGGGFVVHTNAGELRARSVLLAIGRRGTPRKLEVPGEELPKVVYRVVDPAQYRDQRVLVVGGGDSAVEAALACAVHAEVTVSYRGQAMNRLKPANRARLEDAVAQGKLRLLLLSEVQSIAPASVSVRVGGQIETIGNDWVVVCAGGVLPNAMLQAIGVQVETKRGTA